MKKKLFLAFSALIICLLTIFPDVQAHPRRNAHRARVQRCQPRPPLLRAASMHRKQTLKRHHRRVKMAKRNAHRYANSGRGRHHR